MDLKTLGETPPWDWPEDAKATILGVLGDPGAAVADRVLAARLAGEPNVLDDEVASALLAVLRTDDLPAELRARAAIAFGASLEMAEIDGFDLDPELFGEAKFSQAAFRQVQEALRAVHSDARSPKEVRRRALEASSRAPRKWHRLAVRAAYRDDDPDWRLTAVFCMGYVPGFDAEIVEALGSEDEAVRHEAVSAAGERGVEAAWPLIAAILADREAEKDLLLAAIEAAATVKPDEALEALTAFVASEDEDVAAAAEEALSVAGQVIPPDEFEDEDRDDVDDDTPWAPSARTGISRLGNVVRLKTKVNFGPEGVPLDQLEKIGEAAAAESARIVRELGARVGRNEPCPCGSGKKYKKCCGR